MLKHSLTAAALVLALGASIAPGMAEDDRNDDRRAFRDGESSYWMEGNRRIYLGESRFFPGRGLGDDGEDDGVAFRNDDDDDDGDDDRDDRRDDDDDDRRDDDDDD